MKKKLALLLASVMALSAVPMNLFAATGIQGMASYVPKNTVLYENGVIPGVSAPLSNVDGVTYVVDGSDLVVTMDASVRAGQQFRVSLENAEWFFKKSTDVAAADFNKYALGTPGLLTATTISAVTATADPTNIADPLVATATTAVTTAIATVKNSTYDLTKPADILQMRSDQTLVKNKTIDLVATDTTGKVKKELAGVMALSDGSKSGIYAMDPVRVPGLTASGSASAYAKINAVSTYLSSSVSYTDTNAYAGKGTTYDISKGIFSTTAGGVGGTGTYYRYPVNPFADPATGYAIITSTDTGAAPSIAGVAREIPYKMAVQTGYGVSSGVVTILPINAPTGSGGFALQELYPLSPSVTDQKYVIRIPLVVRTTAESDVKVRIEEGSTLGIQSATHLIGVAAGASTTMTTSDINVNFRDELKIGQITIKENRVNTIATGGVLELKAPVGFGFDMTSDFEVGVDTGLAWRSTGLAGKGAKDSDYYAAYKATGTGTNYFSEDRSTIYIYIPATNSSTGVVGNIIKSQSITGALYVRGLKMYADTNAAFGPVSITANTFTNGTLANMSSTAFQLYNVRDSFIARGITTLPNTAFDVSNLGTSNPMTALVGTRADWTMALTAVGTIPTLTTGRYISNQQYGAEDAYHKTAGFKLNESAVNAWWAGRETKITLSPDAKFRRVAVTARSNVSPDLRGIYLADGTRKSNIQVDSNSITLYNLTVAAGELGSMTFDAWVSLAANFTGDLKVFLANTTNSTVTNTANLELVVAKTQQPVTIKTDVTELKVGYQTMATGNVTITETVPGALMKGKQLLVSVSDMITQDLYFAPINPAKDIETPGELKVSNIVTVNTDNAGANATFGANANNSNLLLGGGTIAMDIATPSVLKAGSITLKNLNVKVNRSVPQSTVNYKVIAWGTAVAENYGPNKDEFTVPGISTEYIKVISSATDKTSVLTQEVRLTIGEKYVLVGGKSVDMNEGGVSGAAYLSTKSNSTMVPVRFVAYAFGITPDQVIWDATTLTATIIHPTRIVQFTANSNKMMLNGAPVTMDNGAIAELTGDRMYIPFRALGNAFGITVDWDEPTQTAVYNKAAVVAAPATK